MINNKVCFLVQGPIYKETFSLCRDIKTFFPNHYLLIVTWKGQEIKDLIYDEIIFLDDPGSDLILFKDNVINSENTSRQFFSTKAGIDCANTDYIFKVRSDFKILKKINIENLISIGKDKIIVNNINTIDPFSSLSYVAHISDWYYFSSKKKLKEVFDFNSIPKDFFKTETNLNKNNFKFGSFTAEQIMLKQYFSEKLKFNYPYFFTESNFTKLKYIILLSENFEILSMNKMGLEFKKYEKFYNFSLKNFKPFIGFWLLTIDGFTFKIYKKIISKKKLNVLEFLFLKIKHNCSKIIVK
jgi:hypothetical protein